MSLALHRGFETDSPTFNAGPQYCAYQQFRLEVIEGPDAGATCVSTDVRLAIGSDEGADLRLSDPSVAPYQCEIIVQQDRIDIVDLLHRNNTLVNDVQVEKAHLPGAVVISIGDTKIRFERVSAKMHVRRSTETSYGALVGESAAMRGLFVALERVAGGEMTVLLQGERGVGHEVVAREIHSHSARQAAAFHVVDCAAGHREVERGLITAFEQAAGGTLFLHNVGDMSHDLQSRLLRVFKNGGPGAVADLRIISSSTIDLRSRINQGQFDAHLYRYLSSERAALPPLRARIADLPRLVAGLLGQLQSEEDASSSIHSAECLDRMKRHSWPGNLRELRDHVQHCLQREQLRSVHEDGAGLNPANLNQSSESTKPSPDVDISRPIKAGREEWIKHFERMYLTDILESQGGNVTRAAKAAGVDRGHFYRLMMRCGLRN